MNLYIVPAGDTLPLLFDTFGGNDGASITISGLALGDIKIYKNGSTTQRSSTAGYSLLDTDGIDFNGITGIHGISIDLSDDTDSGFYAVGSWFTVVINAVIINSQTINFIAGHFRIMAAETVAGVPEVDITHVAGSSTTATLDTIKTQTGAIETDTADIQARLPATLVGGRIDASVGAMAAAVLTAAAIATDAINADALAIDAVDEITAAVLLALQSASRRNTAQAGGASTITLDSGANASNDHYNGTVVVLLEGTGANPALSVPERTRRITGYVGSTKVATVDAAWDTNPDATTVFLIFGIN